MTFYTTGCPKCTVLEKKMKQAKVEFETVSDVEKIQKKGISSLPCLEVNGELMGFKAAVDYINKIMEGNM